jgi:hypothetical protein
MMEVVDEPVFPFLGTLGDQGRAMAPFAARPAPPSNASLLAKVVAQLDGIEMADRTLRATSASICSDRSPLRIFPTPPHIIRLMVALAARRRKA